MYSNYVHLYDKKAATVDGGASTVAGLWETRDITDEVVDTGNICTLAANQFTLDAGTYRCLISAPARDAANHLIRLQNITDAATTLLGTVAWHQISDWRETRSYIVGRFTIAAQKTFEIQHRVNNNKLIDGHGTANAWGDNIYTVIELWQEIP